MPASPTSPTQMATAGYYRNGATAICDVAWTVNSQVASRTRNAPSVEVTSAGVLIRTALPIALVLYRTRVVGEE
jgi:hypothetical protein